MPDTSRTAGGGSRWLDSIERLGNALPDPATLFLIGAFSVMLISEVAVRFEWSVARNVAQVVQVPLLDSAGQPVIDPVSGAPLTTPKLDPRSQQPVRERVQVPVTATSLLRADGLYWALKNLVSNFVNFPPLGVVLVGMLGIGVAERSGLIGALLKALMLAVPRALLTPTVFFVGVMSSMGLDAGYVVLPPVAAALFHAAGRSPLVGLAAVFAGVSAGFSANLFITSLDPLLAEFSTASAQLIDPSYQVVASANWWFMIASTVLITGVGWAVTARWVEPRYRDKPEAEGGVATSGQAGDPQPISAEERRGLGWAGLAATLGALLLALAIGWPGAPLHTPDDSTPRWISVIVPLLFIGFLIPGIAYGAATGAIRSDRDVAKLMSDTMAGMGSYIVLAFFAAQFIAFFKVSQLGEMLAIRGGEALAQAALPPSLLVVAFVGAVSIGNLFIGSMSAKYAFFAPVFVPMFMLAGVSPELTQAAYRVGDSVTNVITPLNPYVVIILVFMRRYVPRAGLGSLVALMLPYAIAFALTWTLLLALWVMSGVPLGPGGPLAYSAG